MPTTPKQIKGHTGQLGRLGGSGEGERINKAGRQGQETLSLPKVLGGMRHVRVIRLGKEKTSRPPESPYRRKSKAHLVNLVDENLEKQKMGGKVKKKGEEENLNRTPSGGTRK